MLKIQVVGSGCPNCQKLEGLCREVITEKQLNAQVEKVTDVSRFADLGVFMTPGLLIDGRVVSMGKIPTKSTLANWLEQAG